MSAPAGREAREARLPRWAQNELRRLRANLEGAEQELSEMRGGAESSDTFVVEGMDERPLPLHTLVRFRVMPAAGKRWEHYFDCRLTDDGNQLEVRSGRHLSLLPRAANSVLIELGDR